MNLSIALVNSKLENETIEEAVSFPNMARVILEKFWSKKTETEVMKWQANLVQKCAKAN